MLFELVQHFKFQWFLPILVDFDIESVLFLVLFSQLILHLAYTTLLF